MNQASTTTTITGSTPDPSVVGQDYSVAVSVAAVAPGAGVPSGTVTVTDSDGNTCTVTLDLAGNGACDLPSDSAGTKTLDAHYNGDASFIVSDATSASHAVGSVSTTTSVISSVNPSVSGESVTFTATVSADAPSSATPVGSVEFFDGVTSLGAPVALDSSGQAQLSTSTLAVGSHDITAVFTDSGDFDGSTSPVLTQTVNLASTTTTVTGSTPDPSVVGQDYSVSVGVVAVAPGTGVPTGTVHVSDSDGNGCDVTLGGGSGSCMLPSDSAGSKTLDAHYQGDASFDTSDATAATHEVDAAATTTVVASNLNPSVFGQDVTFTATVSADSPSTATPVGLIQFKIDGIDFGAQVPVDGSGHAAVHTSALSVGGHSVQAFFVDASDFISSNGSLVPQQQVNVAFSSTTIVSDTPDPTVVGQDHTVAVHVDAVAPASGVPTGSVTVTDSDGNGCSAVLDGAGNGSCDLPSTSAGTKTIDAHYEGDTSFGVSDATSGSHEVDAADTTTTVASDLNPAVLGQSVTFTATVSANVPSFNVPTGSVQFVVDGGNSGSPVSLDGNGQATLTTSSLGVGSHTVDAHFLGTADYNQSTGSLSPDQVVTTAATTTSITSDTPDPSVTGQSVTVAYSVTVNLPGTGTPAGNVTVTDADSGANCTATVAAGSCQLALSPVGTHHLTAAYAGNASFDASTSSVATHTVTQASTTASITSDIPDPSVVGQSVPVSYTVNVAAPGSGTPTGLVVVTDDDSSAACISTVGGRPVQPDPLDAGHAPPARPVPR